MKNLIGTMQGRLLPKYKGRYQAHPIDYWQKEFEIAKNIGLGCIEFIFDFNEFKKNPLLTEEGLNEINFLIKKNEILVKTICADYFMEEPLHNLNLEKAENSLKVLVNLIKMSSKIGVTDIVIPCVDKSRLKSDKEKLKFISQIKKVLNHTSKYQINITLETDLNPTSFLQLINQIDSDRIKINYDIGNSAAQGYNVIEELDTYGNRISDIHIKDRILNGGPVILGNGNADFDTFFKKLKQIDYKGPFIMQAYRDDEGIEIFKKQLSWINPYIQSLYN